MQITNTPGTPVPPSAQETAPLPPQSPHPVDTPRPVLQPAETERPNRDPRMPRRKGSEDSAQARTSAPSHTDESSVPPTTDAKGRLLDVLA